MKKKGFTLIELIVVIAIIGVLAAILVPAMLGYVRKSKITTANTTAKSIYNAYNTALVDMDTIDKTPSGWDGAHTGSEFSSSASGFLGTVYGYFTDITKVSSFYVEEGEGACVGCGAMSGKYPGAYPKAWTPDYYKNATTKPTDGEAAYNQSKSFS